MCTHYERGELFDRLLAGECGLRAAKLFISRSHRIVGPIEIIVRKRAPEVAQCGFEPLVVLFVGFLKRLVGIVLS